ncbi:MAG: methyltransferase [Pseudomonadales bacterium]|nr:methyltransferase [Pseudomonadales bacterium]MDP7146466.1 methyltransferase [Pseudomonadales bacterium]MDP7358646.1 methyltransferase [Pseudomonadales bacterium]MDP7596845.1 methyltransferase [Pseudomonadales bacterium]HJN52237.1 methyltransferase [Pseudomonadales bacterium]
MHLIHTQIKGFELVFESSDDQFSPRRIDAGTLALLSVVDFAEGDRVLDLGCGYGVVGVLAARVVGPGNVVMVDNDPAAVALARKNCKRNGVEGVEVILSEGFSHMDVTGFDLILSNPPYHTDFAVARHFIEKGFNRLVIGGRILMVTKRRKWYRNKLSTIFGGALVEEIDGYQVFQSVKRQSNYAGPRPKR